MKLKKREITLNEADSLKDVFFTEKALVAAYGEVDGFAFRKETANELSALKGLAIDEVEKIHRLWKKSRSEQL